MYTVLIDEIKYKVGTILGEKSKDGCLEKKLSTDINTSIIKVTNQSQSTELANKK